MSDDKRRDETTDRLLRRGVMLAGARDEVTAECLDAESDGRLGAKAAWERIGGEPS